MTEELRKPDAEAASHDAEAPADETYQLLERATAGEHDALDVLFTRRRSAT